MQPDQQRGAPTETGGSQGSGHSAGHRAVNSCGRLIPHWQISARIDRGSNGAASRGRLVSRHHRGQTFASTGDDACWPLSANSFAEKPFRHVYCTSAQPQSSHISHRPSIISHRARYKRSHTPCLPCHVPIDGTSSSSNSVAYLERLRYVGAKNSVLR